MSFRKLAGETAIYGLASILGRALYFLLTPLYTAIFAADEMGIVALVNSVIGFLMVVTVLRFDVAYFRFGGKVDEGRLLGTAFTAVLATSGVIGLGLLFGSRAIAAAYGYPEYATLFALAGGILFFDSLVELPLAKLRLQRRPLRFAAVRLTGIAVNLGLNLFFLYLVPRWSGAPSWLATAEGGITYIFLANVVSAGVTFGLLARELRGVRLGIDRAVLAELWSFSAPLMVVGFSYIVNELLDRQILPLVWPGGEAEGLELNGVYSQNYKLAMLLALFTQAFRYGAEPFFFRESGSADAKTKYADLARLYLVAALLGAVAVALFLPVASQLFLKAEVYRAGSDVVPILLLANVFLGLYYNLAVWYKVTDNTRYGAYVSVGGAVLTVVLNLLLIPRLGFYGCAWATLACYAAMTTATYALGRRHYPIAYDWARMGGYTALAVALFAASWLLGPHVAPASLTLAVDGGTWSEWAAYLALNGGLLVAFAAAVGYSEWGLLRARRARSL